MTHHVSLQTDDKKDRKFIVSVRILFSLSVLVNFIMAYYIIQNMQKIDAITKQQNNYISAISLLNESKSLFYKVMYDVKFNTSNHYIINQDLASLQKSLDRLVSIYGELEGIEPQLHYLHSIQGSFEKLENIHNNALINREYKWDMHNMVGTINNSTEHLLEQFRAQLLYIQNHSKHYSSQNYGFYILNLILALGLLSTSYLIVDRQLGKSRYFRNLLIQKVHLLDSTNKSLEQYTYIASHDLKEPTRKISLLVEKLLHSTNIHLDEKAIPILHKIHSSSVKMGQLIDDLLLFSKISNSKIDKTIFNLRHVIDEILYDLQDVITKKKATLHIDSLPTLYAHKSLISQLFQNILSNALKYAREDTLPLISIKHTIVTGDKINSAPLSEADNLFDMISITDNGIGFKQENASKIFKPFQRLHNLPEYSGTGIGLAICEKVVQQHNGYIEAIGKENTGARFTIYFPHHIDIET